MRRRYDPLAFVLASGFYALFYSVFFIQSLRSTSYIAPSDSLDFGMSTFIAEPALWTDGMYSGYPVAADPQTLTWYPILRLFQALHFPWNAFMIAAYVIASAACFLLVRRVTGSTLAGVFAGLVYGFSGVMLAHIAHFNQIHAAAWMPLVPYGLYLIRTGQRRSGMLAAAVGYSLMWLAGHPQVAVYTFYMSVALVYGWHVIDRPERGVAIDRARWSAIALAGGIGLAAVVLVPMLELSALSRRGAGRWDLYIQGALPPRQLLSLIFPFGFGGFFTASEIRVPYFGENSPVQTTSYIGLLPLGLAAFAMLRASPIRKEARLWMLLGVVILLLCLGPATPLGWLFFYVPGYASFQLPARQLFLFTLCAAVASGLGLAHFVRVPNGRRGIPMAIALIAAGGLLMGALVAARTRAARELIAGSSEYLRWAIEWPMMVAAALAMIALIGCAIGGRPRLATTLAAVLIVMHVGEVAVVHYMLPGYHFTYAEVPPDRVAPRPEMAALGTELRARGQKILAVDGSRNRFLLPNFPRAWHIPSTSGTGSLGIERYLDVLRMGGSGDVDVETFAPKHQGLDLLGVAYALVPLQSPITMTLRAQPDRWTAVSDLRYDKGNEDTWYTLFSNARARPRAWCASDVVSGRPADVLRAIRSGQLPGGQPFDPARTALVEDDQIEGWKGSGAAGTYDIETAAVEPGHRSYFVNSASPCLLVLSEVYYPWWRASVDDAAVDVVRVDHTLIAVPLSSGSHVVRVWMRPVSIWIGAALSIATALALIVACATLTGGRKQAREPAVRTRQRALDRNADGVRAHEAARRVSADDGHLR